MMAKKAKKKIIKKSKDKAQKVIKKAKVSIESLKTISKHAKVRNSKEAEDQK